MDPEGCLVQCNLWLKAFSPVNLNDLRPKQKADRLMKRYWLAGFISEMLATEPSSWFRSLRLGSEPELFWIDTSDKYPVGQETERNLLRHGAHCTTGRRFSKSSWCINYSVVKVSLLYDVTVVVGRTVAWTAEMGQTTSCQRYRQLSTIHPSASSNHHLT